MDTQLTKTDSANRYAIIPPTLETQLKPKQRAVASRLLLYVEWLDSQDRQWTNPSLAEYKQHMLDSGKAASTVNAHLSSIRSRYADMLRDKMVIAELDNRAVEYCRQNGFELNPANVMATVNRQRDIIQNGLNVKRAKELKIQDREESEFTRLPTNAANALLRAPGTDTLVGLRDTALIALALATGARAAELAALQIGEHKARNESGALALKIAQGKGNKQRLVPYGALEFAAVIVDAFVKRAGITNGPIFRGILKDGKTLRDKGLSVVAIENILSKYPVAINGERKAVKPHDLRRTYAKLAYLSGMKLAAIQDNLGHANVDTTRSYIGELDSADRQPTAFLSFDLALLKPQKTF